jgi:hypothetical protein
MRTQRDSPGTIGTGEPSRSLTGHPVAQTPGWPVLARAALLGFLSSVLRVLATPGRPRPAPHPLASASGAEPASQPGRQCAPTGAAKYRGAFHRQRRPGSHSGKAGAHLFHETLTAMPVTGSPRTPFCAPVPPARLAWAPLSFRGRGALRHQTPAGSFLEVVMEVVFVVIEHLYSPPFGGASLDCQHGKHKIRHVTPGGFVLNSLPSAP